MNVRLTAVVLSMRTVCAPTVFAQTVGSEVQRDINQETRIEQGVQSGQLSTKEAARLERGEARIDRMKSKALKDGTLSPDEQARIQRAQNQESGAIGRLKHNDVTGNTNSASSQRMQEDVQRNINQQQRIEQGVQSGQLTNTEVCTWNGFKPVSIGRKHARERMATSDSGSTPASSIGKTCRAGTSTATNITTKPTDGPTRPARIQEVRHNHRISPRGMTRRPALHFKDMRSACCARGSLLIEPQTGVHALPGLIWQGPAALLNQPHLPPGRT